MVLEDEVSGFDGLENLTFISRGGFASVYTAYEPTLDRVVAVKIYESIDINREDFFREVKAIGSLSGHPNIAEIYRYGTTPDGQLYFAMPYYRDGSLQDVILFSGRISESDLLSLGVKVSGALAAVHSAGIAHGDVKPGNILFSAYKEPILTDFGTAVWSSLQIGDNPPNAFTVRYAAPEVLLGGHVQPASDVFSLAMTLVSAAGCELWRPGQTTAEAYRTLMAEIQLPDDLAPNLKSALSAGLRLDPNERPTAIEFGQLLQGLQRESGQGPTRLLLPAPAQRAPGLVASVMQGSRTEREPASPTLPPPASALGPPGIPVDVTVVRSPPGWEAPTTKRPAGPPEERSERSHPSPDRSVELWRRIRSRKRGPRVRVVEQIHDRFEEDLPAGRIGVLQSDRPSATDLLGNEPIVEGLARVLNDPGTALPLTIALTGRWGAGKSSTMLQLDRRLRTTDDAGRIWTSVWFDAWRFQGREALWVGLTRAIYRQAMGQQGGVLGRLSLRFDLLRRRRGVGRMFVASVGAALLLAAGITAGAAATKQTNSTVIAVLSAAGAAVVAALGIATSLRDPFERMLRASSVSKSSLGPTDVAEEDIDHLVQALSSRKPNGALIVFLDDLDRCDPEVIRQALVCVSEVFGRRTSDKVVFVLGVDMELVASVVDRSFAEVRASLLEMNPGRKEVLGRQFLEKVFQLQVSLESTRRVPTERLLGREASRSVSSSAREQFLNDLRELPISEAADLTAARREFGLATVNFSRPMRGALRAAIRVRRAELLSSGSREVLAAERQLLGALSLSPRAVKQFDNTYRLQLQIAANTPGSELDYAAPDLLALAKWVALRLFFPRVATSVSAQVGLWEELESLAASPHEGRLRTRLIEIGALSLEEAADLGRIIGLGLPEATLQRLPLHTFAGVA